MLDRAFNDAYIKRCAIGLNQLFTFSGIDIKCLGEFMKRVYHMPIRFGLCSFCHIREKAFRLLSLSCAVFALEKKKPVLKEGSCDSKNALPIHAFQKASGWRFLKYD